MGKFIDLTGKRFGRLIVIKRANNKSNNVCWLCRCDCGNEKIITREHLRRGYTTSCGCYNKEKISLPFGEASQNSLFFHYRTKCKNKNIIFELSKDKFLELTKQNCFYCGKKPSNIKKNIWDNGDYIYNGIDRIDSIKGYTKENTVPCCGICNQAKMAQQQEKFFEWIKTVHSNLSSKGLI
jgi:hypothetical protein